MDRIKELLNLKSNKKLVQNALAEENIFVTLKDLTNIKSSTKTVDGNDLKRAVDYSKTKGMSWYIFSSPTIPGITTWK